MSVRRDAEEALQKELNFAAHLGLPAVMVSLNALNNPPKIQLKNLCENVVIIFMFLFSRST